MIATWENGYPKLNRRKGSLKHQSIEEVFYMDDFKNYQLWISGDNGTGIFEVLSDGEKIRRWSFENYEKEGLYVETWWDFECSVLCYFKNDVLHGEYREWPIMRGTGKHCFYINGEIRGEYKRYDDAFSGGKLVEHCFIVGEIKYDVEEAKKIFPEGPWLKDAEFTEQITIRPFIL